MARQNRFSFASGAEFDRLEDITPDRRRDWWLSRLLDKNTGRIVETWAREYAEPGYDDPPGGFIVFGDWNRDAPQVDPSEVLRIAPDVDIDPDDTDLLTLGRVVELLGGECEWSDEWSTCSHCGRAVRTSPDCYHWTPSYVVGDGELSCADCVATDPHDYIRSIVGRDDTAVTLDNIDLSKHGFLRLHDRYENGWHPGMDADPKKIGAALRSIGIDKFIFAIADQSQFYTTFVVWVDRRQARRSRVLKTELAPDSTRADIAPSELLRRGLADASAKLAELDTSGAPGIRYAQVDTTTGKADARIVPPDEFMRGIGK